jgi:hypothetical protein
MVGESSTDKNEQVSEVIDRRTGQKHQEQGSEANPTKTATRLGSGAGYSSAQTSNLKKNRTGSGMFQFVVASSSMYEGKPGRTKLRKADISRVSRKVPGRPLITFATAFRTTFQYYASDGVI